MFKLKTFVKELVEEFDEVEYVLSDYTLLAFNGDTLMSKTGDINFVSWHNGIFEGHPLFELDNGFHTFIKTDDEAQEFKRLLRTYSKGAEAMRKEMDVQFK